MERLCARVGVLMRLMSDRVVWRPGRSRRVLEREALIRGNSSRGRGFSNALGTSFLRGFQDFDSKGEEKYV